MLKKVILGSSYGSFEPNEEYKRVLKENQHHSWHTIQARTDEKVIAFVEKQIEDSHNGVGKESYMRASVAKVDNSKPWTIEEYDGAEYIQSVEYIVIDEELNYVQWVR